ncbi:MAG: hypothetical protein VYE15_04655 [Myxococcota bacterium]|nr:hypothetical protein [Myxococcota bacterium]
MARRWLICFGCLLLVTALGACSDGDAELHSCTTETEATDCDRGQICVDGTCQAVECIGVGSCLTSNQICFEGNCTALECSATAPCAPPDVCVDGLCVDQGLGGNCTTDTECASGQVCDVATGQCRICEGLECETTEDPCGGLCTAAQTCDEATGTCIDAPSNGADWACDPCTTEADCDGGLCVPLSSGKVCLQGCGSDNDCVTGWSCQAGACAPAGFSCAGCLTDGCSGGQVCNTISGECASPTSACDLCTYDWECGPTQACVKSGPGLRVCKPRCTNSECPAGTTCTKDSDSNIDICDGGCSEAPCNPACGGATPHCVNSSCVQCIDDTHCTEAGATCNTQTGFCEGDGAQCADPTPYFKGGQCVECLNDGHCQVGTCNVQTGACSTEPGGDVCASCDVPYPACTKVGEEWYCVQCTSDEDCGLGGTCDTATYSCSGGTVSAEEPCTTDADCDAGITDYNLKCDAATGYCHDTSGKCDDVTAFCKGGGECLSLLDALMGGAGGGGGGIPPEFPGMTGTGSTLPGYCKCDSSGGLEDFFGGFLPGGGGGGTDVCGDAICLNLGDVLGFAGGGGGGGGGGGDETSVCFDLGGLGF